MENYIEYGYVGLAVISFLAATILPVGSEVFFMAMIPCRLVFMVGFAGQYAGRND